MKDNSRTLYLNNSGSRWVVVYPDGNHSDIVMQTKSGKEVIRKVIYYESFGNFACVCISYKGKKIKVLTGQKLED